MCMCVPEYVVILLHIIVIIHVCILLCIIMLFLFIFQGLCMASWIYYGYWLRS